MPPKISIPPGSDLLAAAFDRHLKEIRALLAEDVLARTNFDVATAVSTVLGAQPALLTLRAQIERMCPETPVRYVDELDTIAYAALFAHMRSITAAQVDGRIAPLAEQAKTLRKTLMVDATAAVHRGLVDTSALDDVPMGNGRLDIARGVLGLGVVFRASWSRVKGKTAVTEQDLDEAARLGVELLTLLGQDDNPTLAKKGEPAQDERLRACTLLVRVYTECRRAVSYVRWYEGDASEFVPPLTGQRARARQPGSDGGDDPPTPPTPPAPPIL